MNLTKFFFTSILLFFFSIITQAQVIETTPSQNDTTVSEEKAEIQMGQSEELSFETNTNLDTNTVSGSTINTTAAPAGTNITSSTPDAFAFYFKYKQYLKPVIRKSALC